MEAFFEALDIKRPFVIGESAGGYYVLPFLLKPDPLTCGHRIRGLITIGLVGADRFTPSQYHRCEV